jgi:parallel beta helix pectate lyase-like protein
MDSQNVIGKTAELRRAFNPSGQTSRRTIEMRLGMVAIAVIGTAAMFASAPGVRAQEPEADAAVTDCVSPIASCGCTITKSGLYTLANDLSSSQGLTAKNGCIDIRAPKVVLNAAKPVTSGTTHGAFNLSGPGGMTPTDIGVHILKGSNKDFIELGGSRIEGWDVGILVEGSGNIVEFFQAGRSFTNLAVPNGTAGVEINGGSNNNINDFDGASRNKNYGVWLRGASNNQINCSNSDDNGNIGVYIGCSVNGPVNGKCSPAVPPSNNNLIYDHESDNNGKFGIVIDLGNTGNIVTDFGGHSNGTKDLLDENTNCGGNHWFFDGFDTASPGCIE